MTMRLVAVVVLSCGTAALALPARGALAEPTPIATSSPATRPDAVGEVHPGATGGGTTTRPGNTGTGKQDAESVPGIGTEGGTEGGARN